MEVRERKSRPPGEETPTLMWYKVWTKIMRGFTLVWWGMFWVKQKPQPTSVLHLDQVIAWTIKAWVAYYCWRCVYMQPSDGGWWGWLTQCDKDKLRVSSVPYFDTRTFLYNFYMSYARFCNQEKGILFFIQFVWPCKEWTNYSFLYIFLQFWSKHVNKDIGI